MSEGGGGGEGPQGRRTTAGIRGTRLTPRLSTRDGRCGAILEDEAVRRAHDGVTETSVLPGQADADGQPLLRWAADVPVARQAAG